MIQQLQYKDLAQFRDQILKKQNHTCPVCGKEIINPVLDHHHIRRVGGTGQIRGVLCRSCNILLGKMENNCKRYNVSQEELPDALQSMAKYLRKKHKPYYHPSEAKKQPILMKSSYNQLSKVVKKHGKLKIPEYPKSGKLTKRLAELFNRFSIKPRFYS